MDAAADRLEFAPPTQPGLVRGMVLALLAHLLLLLALTWGVQWKRDSQDLAAEAELWSSVPQQAAPKEVVKAPPVPPQPTPVQREEPKPEPKQRDAEIALEKEKQRKQREAEARREAEEDRREQQRKKAEAERKEKEELKKQEQAKLAAENRKKEAEKQRKEKQAEELAKKTRQENIERARRLAGTAPEGPGTAAQSSGPSASWAGRVRARVKPNIVFSDDVPGNPTAEVELKLAPDGTIVSRRISKPSGVKAWDDAVLRALDKTETLPRDTDGRVPQSGTMVFRLKDF